MTSTKWKPVALVVVLILLSFCIVLLIFRDSNPTGGEIFSPDLRSGVRIYVEEAYSESADYARGSVESPHSLWLVSDEGVGKEILSLCGEIRQHREYSKFSDTMLGGIPEFEHFPHVFLISDAVAYRIAILNWDNYAGSEWIMLPIRQELMGEPVLRVFRIELCDVPEDETPYSYVKNFCRTDSVNSSADGLGWYSTMPRESMDALLSLLQNIGPENAEELIRYQ